jgi:hypothetical protein
MTYRCLVPRAESSAKVLGREASVKAEVTLNVEAREAAKAEAAAVLASMSDLMDFKSDRAVVRLHQ